MNSFICLVKVQLLSFMGVNKLAYKNGKKRNSAYLLPLIMLLGFGGLIGYNGYIYGDIFRESVVSSQGIEYFVPMMTGMIFLVLLIISFSSINSMIYKGKDYQLLSAMPIKPLTIISSKLLTVFLVNFLIMLTFTSSSIYFTFDYIGGFDGKIFIRLILMMIGVSVFSVVISLIICGIFAVISSQFRRSNLVQILLMLLFFGLLTGLSMINSEFNPVSVTEKVFFLMPLVVKGYDSWGYMALVLGIPLVLLIAITYLFSGFYNKINALILRKKTLKNFHLKGNYKGRKVFTTLYFKEIKTLFSYPVYGVNVLLGGVLAVVSFIVLGVVFSEINNALGESESFAIMFVPMIILFFCICPSTSSSISAEGENFRMIVTLPVSSGKMLMAKLALSLTFYLPVALIGIITVSLLLKFSLFVVVMMTLLTIFIVVFGSGYGLLANLIFPVFHYENIATVVKQSKAVFMTVITAMLMSVLSGVVTSKINLELNIWLTILVLFFLVLNLTVYGVLIFCGKKLMTRCKEKI